MKLCRDRQSTRGIWSLCTSGYVNGFIYTSGQIPLTAEGLLVEGTIEEQTNQVFENLKAVLDAADSSLDKVVKATVFINEYE